jgi:hypothetical protein
MPALEYMFVGSLVAVLKLGKGIEMNEERLKMKHSPSVHILRDIITAHKVNPYFYSYLILLSVQHKYITLIHFYPNFHF